jgi:anti-sigma B factor antagonist
MPLKIGQDSKFKGLCKLTIDNDMTIYAIKELKNSLDKEIELYQQFDLDLSAVEEIDTAGIQFLLALKRELLSKNKELKISSVSTVVSTLMESYSVNNFLNSGASV